ncbi:MAG: hypothetical protein V3R34_07710 [Hyphomicrobium sp.]
MANDLEDYLLSPTHAGMARMLDWTPVALPDLAGQAGGFQLGLDVPGSQLSAAAFIGTALQTVWSVLPSSVQSDITSAITDITDALASGTAAIDSTIGNVLGGVMEGLGSAVSYVEAMNKVAQWVVGIIDNQLEENDERRYEGRLLCTELLREAGPLAWTGNNYFNLKYRRKIYGKTDPWNFVWPPDSDWGVVLEAPVPRSCNLGEKGGSNLAPRDSGCKGSFSLFPIYMPIWGNRALGTPGPAWSMRAGMERAPEGGARIWRLMSEMQGSLLTDPIMNLQADAASVYWRMQGFLSKVWFPSLNHTMATTDLRIDPEFNEKNNGKGFYYTPGKLIGAYTNTGGGSLTHEDLRSIVRMPDQTAPSEFGGFGVSFADYNTIVSSTCQFLSLRIATLRRREFCQRAVDEGIVGLMPELAARKAVVASAKGAKGPPVSGTGFQPGRFSLTRPNDAPTPGKGGGGLVAVAGLAAVAAIARK